MKKGLLNAIFEICERGGAIKHVGPEHYNAFLNISDKQMETTIYFIVRVSANYINSMIFGGHWKSDDDLYEYVRLILMLMAKGIMAFEDESMNFVFFKPIGSPPDGEIEQKIDKKIEKSIPLIRSAVLRCLRENKGKK